MPHEAVILSARPVDFIDVLGCASAHDRDHQVRTLWKGGAWQLFDTERALLTIGRSTVIGVDDTAAIPPDSVGAYLTEVAAALHSVDARIALEALIDRLDGQMLGSQSPADKGEQS